MKTLFQFITLFAVALLTVTSCSKEDVNVTEDVENYTNEVVYEFERDCNAGHKGCFEFVWPLGITYPEGETIEYDDYETLRAGIKEWREANPDASERPKLSFPLDIMGNDGTIYTIDDKEELKAVVKRCVKAYWNNSDHRNHFNNSCFRMVFPINIKYPNGNVATFTNKHDLKAALRIWKNANPDAEQRPHIAFPVNLILKSSGNAVTIDSRLDLIRLKNECSGG